MCAWRPGAAVVSTVGPQLAVAITSRQFTIRERGMHAIIEDRNSQYIQGGGGTAPRVDGGTACTVDGGTECRRLLPCLLAAVHVYHQPSGWRCVCNHRCNIATTSPKVALRARGTEDTGRAGQTAALSIEHATSCRHNRQQRIGQEAAHEAVKRSSSRASAQLYMSKYVRA